MIVVDFTQCQSRLLLVSLAGAGYSGSTARKRVNTTIRPYTYTHTTLLFNIG